jgi:hypothetical protein
VSVLLLQSLTLRGTFVDSGSKSGAEVGVGTNPYDNLT